MRHVDARFPAFFALALAVAGCHAADETADAEAAPDASLIDSAVSPLGDATVGDAAEVFDAGSSDAATTETGPKPDAQAPKLDSGAGTGSTLDGGACSCAGLDLSCGPARTDDCCARPLVMGGSFARSYDGVDGGEYTDAAAVATVSDFRLDKYEVTVGRFRKFVDAYRRGYSPAAGAGKNAHNPADTGWNAAWNAQLPPDMVTYVKCEGFHTWDDSDVDFTVNHKPINCISWYVAYAFCAWDGGRLPTEAEWNYAAAGGSDQRAYPWSSPPSSTTIDATYAVYFVAPPVIVGTKSPTGDGRYGHVDLAGNLHEWTLDVYQKNYALPCADCANLDLDSGTKRVFRGGAYFSDAPQILTSGRFADVPEQQFDSVGVRCAWDP